MKKFFLKKTSAFTLIEMIIVMTIIGVLVTVSVSSYTVVQRRTRLDISLDTLISTLKEQRDKTRVGRVDKQGNNGELSCHGLFFDQKGIDLAIQIVSMRYVAVDRNRADFCDFDRSFVKQSTGLTQDQGVFIKNITLGSGVEENIREFALFFKPPSGIPVAAMGLNPNALASSLALSSRQNPLKITLGLSNTAEEMTLIFDFLTGVIKKLP